MGRALLECALLNLVVNARGAMPRGGALIIETANIDVTADFIAGRAEMLAPGRHVMIAVTGISEGVGQEHLGRIFEPFLPTCPP
ncbi:hypothetical protein [Rubrimonas cliftonensis]|uniref:Uncharacterized protein n=1 Tax=Rubrimonas cliftonensis TaxID=89524 RepID=A0A1H3VS26_9RHOB|nr:hypothetical protein [Rubrimonas cliftonensis]SDZ77491.1 hypothetical protein SAMN05444370_101286 [Rubrimonas cliftonensis]